MSIPGRVWRLIRAELNAKLGRFGAEHADAHIDADEEWQWQVPEPEPEPEIAAHYRVLELEYGADLSSVRAAYKRLVKRYHPDKFRQPAQRDAATEILKKLNAAHTELTAFLSEKR